MAARKMIADAGGTRKVMGSRIATPLTEPSPGIAPMNSPSAHPKMISPRFIGCTAIANPSIRWLRISIISHRRTRSGPAHAYRYRVGIDSRTRRSIDKVINGVEHWLGEALWQGDLESKLEE